MQADHQRLLRAAFSAWNGHELDTQGDAFFVAFARATDAVEAAAAAQCAIVAQAWPEGVSVRMRVGLHTGEPTLTAGGYIGMDVVRAARLCAAGHGGQVLLSQATRILVGEALSEGVRLRDMGERRLKDLQRSEHIFQLVIPGLPADFPPLKTLDRRPHNLPAQVTSLIGREKEIEAIQGLLLRPGVRLLTLTGPGGAGKTRLALQAAADTLDAFEHGAFFVSLASLSDSDLVISAIAQTLGVKESPGQPLPATVKDYLRDRSLLLALDNFEQVVEAGTQVAGLLTACPQLKVMVTSRAALRVYGEHEFPVPPLTLPDRTTVREDSVSALTQYEAVRLFIERALAVKPGFSVNEDNAPVVAEICHRLDGLPLAIELAAVRIRLLPPQAMLARLVGATSQSPLHLLTGGARDLPVRQQTLRATIDWSYNLLESEEQALFRRLSVFVGGFTLEAAEDVCRGAEEQRGGGAVTPAPTLLRSPAALGVDVLGGVDSLISKSLLRQEKTEGVPRFGMLGTIREYALERLTESGEAEAVHRLHAHYYLVLAEAAEPELRGPQQAVQLNQMEEEHDNMRTALRWCAERGEAERGLRLGGALWRFWEIHGYLTEGRERLMELLGLAGALERTAARAKALNGAGALASRQGDYAAARALHEESLAIRRTLDDQQDIAWSLNNLGLVAADQGDYAAARALHEESLAIRGELDDRQGIAASLNNLGLVASNLGDHDMARSLYQESLAILGALGNRQGIANLLNNLGNVAYGRGEWEAARALYEESLAIRRALGDRWGISNSLSNLGEVAHHQGDYAAARALCEEGLVIQRALGDRLGIASSLHNLGLAAHYQGDYAAARALCEEGLAIQRALGNRLGIARSLDGFAVLAGAQGQPERAARLFGAAEGLRDAIGALMDRTDRAEHHRNVAAARAGMREEAFAAAWAEGRAVTSEQAIAYALATKPP